MTKYRSLQQIKKEHQEFLAERKKVLETFLVDEQVEDVMEEIALTIVFLQGEAPKRKSPP